MIRAENFFRDFCSYTKERFSTVSIRGDLFGGVTTAVISLPLALAFGVASGAGAQAGLYGAVLVGLFAALFGGSRTLISEPTGPMTVIMTAVITNLIASNPEHGLSMAFATVIIAGLTQILFGVLRLGRYITLMPYSVISGFMSGIGILLMLMQIAPMLGQKTPSGGALGLIASFPDLLINVSGPEIFLAIVALAVLFYMPQSWRKFCPPHLIAMIIGLGVSLILFSGADINRIGHIPMGLPDFQFPHIDLSIMSKILVDGAVLGMLGCIDSLLTAMIADSLTRNYHNSNRELIGQGIGNMVSGFFGGLPGAGATMGTVVNIQVGAKSPLAAVVRSLILLCVILLIAPFLESVPMAVLAAIAFKVGMDILDWSFLKRAHRLSVSATVIMYGVLALTVFVDLLVAVGLGVFIANILTIEKLSKLQSNKVRSYSSGQPDISMSDQERSLFDKAEGKIALLYLSGPMIFGVAKAIAREQESMKQEKGKVLLLDLSDVPILSTTVALSIENMVQEAMQFEVPVIIGGASGEVHKYLERLEETGLEVTFTETRLEALQLSLKIIEDHKKEKQNLSNQSKD